MQPYHYELYRVCHFHGQGDNTISKDKGNQMSPKRPKMVWNQVFFRYKYKKFEPPSFGGASIGGPETSASSAFRPKLRPCQWWCCIIFLTFCIHVISSNPFLSSVLFAVKYLMYCTLASMCNFLRPIFDFPDFILILYQHWSNAFLIPIYNIQGHQ